MSTDPWLRQDELAARRPFFDDDAPVESQSRVNQLLAAIRIEKRHLKAVGLLLLVAAIAAIWLLSQSRTEQTHLPLARPSTVSKSPSEFAPSTGQSVVVDVVGRVKHPGVYRLAPGSRAVDAVAAAGGVLPGTDMTTINLAQHVEDGDQIIVGVEPVSPTGSSARSSGKLNLNRATVQDLDALPGVGPVLAARITAWRKAHGRFRAIEDLRKVPGVGDAKFADLRPLVRT